MRRQCARPGCSAVATATFTFDSGELTVWLDAPFEGAARAGDLCTRHARSLAPPRGWQVIDRRIDATRAASAPGPRNGAVAAPAAPNVAAGRERTASSAARPANAGWYPRFDRADTLDGVLDASTPLLSRAFRNVRAV